MKEGCSCVACRIEEAILCLIAAPTPERFRENVETALPGMIPIVGVMLATLPPHELEPTWRLMLDARSRALMMGHDQVGAVLGRA